MKNLLVLLALALLVIALPSGPVKAQDHDRDRNRDWHGDIHHFQDHDFDRWRGGNWFHGPHGGRDGWWWIVDGSWFFYPSPVYPYPDPYMPPAVVASPAPPAPGAPVYWYYCRKPQGYYPYVPECFGHWHRVVAGVTSGPPVVLSQPPVVVQQPMAQPPIVVQPPYQAAPQPSQMTMAPSGMPVSGSNLTIRQQDDRQLNNFAVEFSHIDQHGSRAASKLKALADRVEAYRQVLFQRSYNAMDILKDTENLQQRISEARARVAQRAPASMNAPEGMAPPAYAAPGSAPSDMVSPPMPLTAPQ